MKRIVFYSWQSDHANPCNRGFIQGALEAAASGIAADAEIAIEPVIDRDTQNVPGSPDIASTIFAKIVVADVFVADVSIISRSEATRPCPNPNVLIELGYAMHAIGHERIILVFNRAFGRVEELPFDLRIRRVVTYEMKADASDRATERKKLAKVLDAALRSAFATAPMRQANGIAQAVDAIETVKPNRAILLRRALDEVFNGLFANEPRMHRDGGTAEELVEAIKKTQEPVAGFSRIVQAVAAMNDLESVRETCRWFGRLYEKYDHPPGFSGRSTTADYDYFKFLGHELYVTLIALLLREFRWEAISQALDEPIQARTIRHRGAQNVGWDYGSRNLPLLEDAGRSRKRTSLHADILKERHSQGGGLAEIMPFQAFMDGDYFLFLLSATLPKTNEYGWRLWRPWSCLYLQEPPMFLHAAEKRSVAAALANLFKLPDIETLKKLIVEQAPTLRSLFGGVLWDSPIEGDDVDRIGRG